MPERDEDGFLSRWSRRKREAQKGVEKDSPPDDLPNVAGPVLAEEEAELDEEALANRAAAEACDIDAMEYGDDFTLFMKRGVPDVLRKKALRKLWRSNPVLANLDGLNDYDDNYGDAALNVYKSTWSTVTGFLTEAERRAQQASGRLTLPDDDAKEAVADITDETGDNDDAVGEAAEPAVAEAGSQADDAKPPEADPAGADDSENVAPGTDEQPGAVKRVSLRSRLGS